MIKTSNRYYGVSNRLVNIQSAQILHPIGASNSGHLTRFLPPLLSRQHVQRFVIFSYHHCLEWTTATLITLSPWTFSRTESAISGFAELPWFLTFKYGPSAIHHWLLNCTLHSNNVDVDVEPLVRVMTATLNYGLLVKSRGCNIQGESSFII